MLSKKQSTVNLAMFSCCYCCQNLTSEGSSKPEQDFTDIGVVSTQDAKGASTDKVKEDLNHIASLLLAVREDGEKKRKRQCEILEEEKKNIHPETEKFLYLTRLREMQHVELMKKLLHQSTVKELVRSSLDEKPHDYSKDDLFFFVAPAYFDGGVQTPEMKEFVDSELKRHHTLEPHHPEYEKYNDGKECSIQDIVEMAIDRLARNVQFGNGRVNLEVMEKFKPNFSLGDNDDKRDKFWSNVLKFSSFVEDSFLEMYPDAKNWSDEKR